MKAIVISASILLIFALLPKTRTPGLFEPSIAAIFILAALIVTVSRLDWD